MWAFPRVDAQGRRGGGEGRGGGGGGGEREAGAFHFIMNKNVLNMLSSHAPSPRRKFSQFISERETLFLCSLFFFSLSFSLPCKKETITKKTPKKKNESLRQNKTNREKGGGKKELVI